MSFGNVDHDRAGPAAGGDMERLVQRARQIGDVLDQIIVFGARPGDADRVAFLERVVADEMGRHLPGDDDERDRIAQARRSSPVTALVAPGPEVTSTVPTLPVERA